MPSGRLKRSRRVRHYALVGGRTRGMRAVQKETLVSVAVAHDACGGEWLPESRALCHLARTPVSAARLSVELGLPFGVVRILLCDLAEKGVVSLHDQYRHDPVVLERVLDGLTELPV